MLIFCVIRVFGMVVGMTHILTAQFTAVIPTVVMVPVMMVPPALGLLRMVITPIVR
jgi:hypothetical protein